jgi:hypothetical protein
MANLRAAMAMEGMTAFRFADAINTFDVDDDWANDYKTFIASLHGKATALATALSPAAKLQAYLDPAPKSGHLRRGARIAPVGDRPSITECE